MADSAGVKARALKRTVKLNRHELAVESLQGFQIVLRPIHAESTTDAVLTSGRRSRLLQVLDLLFPSIEHRLSPLFQFERDAAG